MMLSAHLQAEALSPPLCTLADWGWHSTPAPVPGGRYTLEDVQMDVYDFCGREVRCAVSRFPGNEHVYDWLRQNPHKAHLARIGLRLDGAMMAAGYDGSLPCPGFRAEDGWAVRHEGLLPWF